MSQNPYHVHLRTFFDAQPDTSLLDQATTAYARIVIMLSTFELESARPTLETLYCPTTRRRPRDPVCMLRLLLLMLLCHCESITAWIQQLRGSPLLGALTGFAPDAIPGVGTVYAFLDRLVNGPYQKPCVHVHRPADDDKHRTIRRLKDQTDDRHAYPDIYDSQSAATAADLNAHADTPRLPTLQTRMEDLFVTLGLLPSLKDGLFGTLEQLVPTDADATAILTDAPAPAAAAADAVPVPVPVPAPAPASPVPPANIPELPVLPPTLPVRPLLLDVSGDGSPLESAASPHGETVCECSPEARQRHECDHPRAYTSRTAQWSRCVGRRTRYIFGDRYYHLTAHVNGRDLPLLTLMGAGNEADATLSLKAMDDLQKLIDEQALPLRIDTVSGDMHHDTYSHADWYHDHDILTAIPCRASTASKATPQSETSSDARLASDGTPLCPAGCPMRHHHYDRKKHTHTYACPAKRLTHRHGTAQYVFHPEDCPAGADCRPDSTLGPFEYRKPDDDRRLYPPIPRDSKRFRDLYDQRTTTERLNALHDRYHVDRRARSSAYGLIYLTLAMICEHAVIRYLEQVTDAASRMARLSEVLEMIQSQGTPDGERHTEA